ncbi:urease accessory protein [Nitrosomonas sp. PY1]|uniref:urease accessory protein UreD n=1 Tax=Nitrosomonas sp. PY1 TaxID=1803906 RepID=UPI001FC80FDD|nr:urease accessory protein UreD [Nitrosomonas sp. PY1]GKS69281.1 urease accessory protein [Nitrosomonas sp. PY1]
MPISAYKKEIFEQQREKVSASGYSDPNQLIDTESGSEYTPLQAKLSLKFSEIDGTTRLVEKDRFGPLLVQKPLYPEGNEICHVVVIHPPGGVVSGDELELSAKIGPSAKAQITTPGAAKWYKSNGRTARQAIKIDVDTGGMLEWLPQETIFFNNTSVAIDHQVSLQDDSIYLGCEILCFGRTASGEIFNNGKIKQRTSIKRNGKTIWLEQISLNGEDSAQNRSLALGKHTVCATLLLSGKLIPAAVIDQARQECISIINNRGQVGISQLKSVLVVRYLGPSSEVARQVMLCCWNLFRQEFFGRIGITPRMWNT